MGSLWGTIIIIIVVQVLQIKGCVDEIEKQGKGKARRHQECPQERRKK
jgi:hypothetical protein